MTPRERTLRNILASVRLMDQEARLKDLRRRLNSLGFSARKVAKDDFSAAGMRQIVAGYGKFLRETGKLAEALRVESEQILALVKPGPGEIENHE